MRPRRISGWTCSLRSRTSARLPALWGATERGRSTSRRISVLRCYARSPRSKRSGSHSSTRSRSTGDPRCPLPSRRLEALLLEQARGFGGHELLERLSKARLLRSHQHAARERRDLLQRLRQRPDDLNAGDRQKLADLLDADLGLALRDHLADRNARIGYHDFRFDRIGDTEAREHGGKIEAA